RLLRGVRGRWPGLQRRDGILRAQPLRPGVRVQSPLRHRRPGAALRGGLGARRSDAVSAAAPAPSRRHATSLPVRILAPPLAFKGSLTAGQAARAIESGVHAGWPGAEVVILPLADGGPGTADALVDALGGQWHTAWAHDALGRPLQTQWASWPGGAIVEMALA